MPTRIPTVVLRYVFATALAATFATTSVAQTPDAPPRRLGVFFWHDSPNDRATFEGIQLGLRQAGIPVDWLEREADSDEARAEAMLRELADSDRELVFVMGTTAALLAKQVIQDKPVVFAAVSDPVASGVVPSWLGSDQDNLCGATNWISPQNVLDVFDLAVPRLRKLGMLRSESATVVSRAELARMRTWLSAHPKTEIELVESMTPDTAGIGAAVRRLIAAEVDAIWIPIDLTIYSNLRAVQRALGERKIPLLTTAAAGVRSGAVVGTIADYPLHGRRAANVAAQVLLHGKRPRDLPIDRMAGNLVVVNLGVARELGLELPLSLLVLADRLVDDRPAAGAPK